MPDSILEELKYIRQMPQLFTRETAMAESANGNRLLEMTMNDLESTYGGAINRRIQTDGKGGTEWQMLDGTAATSTALLSLHGMAMDALLRELGRRGKTPADDPLLAPLAELAGPGAPGGLTREKFACGIAALDAMRSLRDGKTDDGKTHFIMGMDMQVTPEDFAYAKAHPEEFKAIAQQFYEQNYLRRDIAPAMLLQREAQFVDRMQEDLLHPPTPPTPDAPVTALRGLSATVSGIEAQKVADEIAEKHATHAMHFENGDLKTSPQLLDNYERKLPGLMARMKKHGITLEQDTFLSQMAKMNANGKDNELDAAELAAGMMALDVLPAINREKETLILGMNQKIREKDLQLAAGHMNEFVAIAKQFLGDNYQVEVRDAQTDEQFKKQLLDQVKPIQKSYDKLR